MIDRYTISASKAELEERFNAEVTDRYLPRYNAAPTQILPVIMNSSPQGFSFLYWGTLPERAKNRSVSEKLINASRLDLTSKTSYKKSLQNRRCLVPADGFYVWKKAGKRSSIPYRIFMHDQPLFSFAGLWDEFEDDHGDLVHTFSIVTVPANPEIKSLSENMPAILRKDQEYSWLEVELTNDELVGLLVPYPGDQTGFYPVSPRIRSINEEGAHLVEPTVASDQFGNYSLFD